MEYGQSGKLRDEVVGFRITAAPDEIRRFVGGSRREWHDELHGWSCSQVLWFVVAASW